MSEQHHATTLTQLFIDNQNLISLLEAFVDSSGPATLSKDGRRVTVEMDLDVYMMMNNVGLKRRLCGDVRLPEASA